MARYRQIYIEFWQDGFVLDLTPEEKYFYIYLMTNSKTTQCGIYELPKRIIETETGYNRETVEKLLQRFVEYGKIAYHEPTKEIMILNWIKYNWINSVKVLSLINKELNEVKNIEFIKLFIQNCKDYGYRIDTLSIPHLDEVEEKKQKPSNDGGSMPYQYPMDSPSIDLGEERELEREREEEREEEQEREQEVVQEVIQFWDDNGFGYNNIEGKTQLLSWLDDSQFPKPKEMILKAMNIACSSNKRYLKYVEGILRNWENESLLTVSEVEQREVSRRNGQPKKMNYNPTKDRF
ncbi:DnaD domain protein [Virgibacillus halodenitrificans]|uniref:DnaD domain-containing protein n=1 Tax=Virgibacillus halodenitrificans TaxID=1482 RepID=UPI001FB56292|nr:DnaD domain protein [Virgibacillus halodenitrificans]MCJ0932953.1 DnaD domain protein [Virgibacillus halodenitrificans]